MAEWKWPHVAEPLADALASGLMRANDLLELEQAVRGLDARRELELHPALHDGLRVAGYGVFPEQRFPRDRGKRRRSEGSRCDVVVTPDGRDLVDDELDEAAWVEVKVVAQFDELGPNGSYAGALQRPVWNDVEKLASDPQIAHGLVALVLFTSDERVARHDLDVWATRATRRGLHLWPRVERRFTIGDRIGHRLCTLALFPLDPT